MVAYLKLPLIALAALGAIVAIIVGQRDLDINELSRLKAAVSTGGSVGLDEEEEDFFNE